MSHTFALGTLLALLSACGGSSEAPPVEPSAVSESLSEAVTDPDDIPAEAVVGLTSAALQPRIAPVGPPGGAPEAVRFSLALPPVDQTGPAGPDTVVEVVPPLPGAELTWVGRATLELRPAVGFVPGATYSVTLKSVESREGRLVGLDDAAWATSVRVPPLVLRDAAVMERDRRRSAVKVRVGFSGVVDAASVEAGTTFTVGGETPRVEWSPATGPVRERVAELFARAAVASEVKVRVGVEGVASAVEPSVTTPVGTLLVEWSDERNATVLGQALVEVESGWSLDVVCDDAAARRGDRKEWFWHEPTSEGYQVSRRCELTDEAADSLQVNPPVALSVVPGDHGFRVFGDLPRGPVTVTLPSGTATRDGGVFAQGWTWTGEVPARSPKVRFVAKGRYLAEDAWSSLPVRHRNVDAVVVEVRHVPPENLTFWLSGDDERMDARTSRVVARFEQAVAAPPDAWATTWLDLASRLPDPAEGVYEVGVTGRGTGASDTSRVMLTGLQLVVKGAGHAAGRNHPEELTVWALDAGDSAGRAGVEVTLVRPSGQPLATCVTRGDGACRLEPEATDDPDTTPPLGIVARDRATGDLTALRFADLQAPVSEADVQGEPWGGEGEIRASVYTDRGVYRPGETARLAVVVRGADRKAVPADVPAVVEVTGPQRNLVKRSTLRLNAAGMATWDLPFSDAASTGGYTAVLMVGDRAVGSTTVNVEAFVPERMEVQVAAVAADVLATEEAAFRVEARYLFGGSAEGSPVELTCRVEPAVFRPPTNGQLAYGLATGDDAPRAVQLGVVSAALDADGVAVVRCPAVAGSGGFAGTGRVLADVAVFEAGSGRSTRGSASAVSHPARAYVGLDVPEAEVDPEHPVTVTGLVVDWQGKPLDGVKEVEVRFERLMSDYEWIWDEWEGGQRWRRNLRPVREATDRVAVSQGRFTTTLSASAHGEGFRVGVSGAWEGASFRTAVDLAGGGWDYWWDPASASVDTTPRPLKPTAVTVQVPAETEVGEATDVRFVAPFRGRALVSVETDRVLEATWLEVEAGEVAWSFTLDRFVETAYVSVLVVKDPHLDTPEVRTPDRAFGVAGVRVVPRSFLHEVVLGVPEVVPSNSLLPVEVTVKGASGPTWVTVAAVDEGILALTKFASPDPARAIFPRRRLDVRTWETVGWSVLLPPSGASSEVGGDSEGLGGQVQAVKPVALWSGLVEVKDGKARVELPVPTYRGKLRVMAVTGDGTRLGSASAQVIVRDPLVVQTTLPRFLVQGDLAQVPVFVTNMTGARATVLVELGVVGIPITGMEDAPTVEVVGGRSGKVTLEDGASGTVVFRVSAAGTAGGARLEVTATSGKHVSRDAVEVPLTPDAPTTREVTRLALGAGTFDVDEAVGAWLPGTSRTSVWVTSNPYAEGLTHLSHVIRYPHGCIEQTTSSTRPLLFVRNLLPVADPELMVTPEEVDKMVLSGVDRVLAMQTASGGFGYWPGDTEANYWGTAYATHMLLDARDAGYAVPDAALGAAVDFIARELRANTGRNDAVHSYAWRAGEAYLHYTLARAGKGDKARIQRLLDTPETGEGWASAGQALERRYMLMSALYLAGDRRYERELRDLDKRPVDLTDRPNGAGYYSDLRWRGLQLAIWQDLFGGEQKVGVVGAADEQLAQAVAAGLARQTAHAYSTQEIVWGVTGLGKRVQDQARGWKSPTLTVGGRPSDPTAVPGGQGDVRWVVGRAAERDVALQVAAAGEGDLFAILTTEGVKAGSTWRQSSQGLEVDREWLTVAGEPVDPGSIQLGDLVVVRLTVTNPGSLERNNLALVDRVPAGFEIENPRLGRGRTDDLGWVDSEALWSMDYMDVRDDRLNVFGKLAPQQSAQVVYAIRAVSAGTFRLPPSQVEAMYDPSVSAVGPAGTVVVAGPFEQWFL